MVSIYRGLTTVAVSTWLFSQGPAAIFKGLLGLGFIWLAKWTLIGVILVAIALSQFDRPTAQSPTIPPTSSTVSSQVAPANAPHPAMQSEGEDIFRKSSVAGDSAIDQEVRSKPGSLVDPTPVGITAHDVELRGEIEPLMRVEPVFDPPLTAGVQGQIVARLQVSPSGQVMSAEVTKANVPRPIEAEVARTLTQWRYPPTTAGFVTDVEVPIRAKEPEEPSGLLIPSGG